MKKRIWSLILVIIMAISMVGCGDKESKASLTSIFEKTKTMTTGAGTMELSFAFDYPQEELSTSQQANDVMKKTVGALKDGISVKLEYVVESMDKVQVAVLYKMKADSDYKKFTDIILCDKAMYVDVKNLKEAIVSLVPELGAYASAIQIEKDYIKFDETELKQLAAMSGVQTDNPLSFPVGNMTELEEQQEVTIALMEKVSAYFEDAVKDIKPEIITGDEDSVTISINKDNLTKVIEALEAADLGKCIDEFVKDGEKLKMQETVEAIKTSKEAIIKDFKETLKECKDELAKEKGLDYNMEYTVGVTGDEGSRKQDVAFKFKAEDSKGKMDLSITANVDEKTDKKVTAPSSSIGYLDFVQSLGIN